MAAWSLLVVGVAVLLPAIPQAAAYHGFVDQRVLWGIPNFGDVVSNCAFLLVGAVGLGAILFGRTGTAFRHRGDRIPYLVFFVAVILIGGGSAYYHWDPTDSTLFWDRAMMSLAFMALFAAVVADRIDPKIGVRYALPICLLVGVSAVVFWRVSGDVRFYLMLAQVWPLSCILLIVFLLFPKGHYVSTAHVALIALFYGSAVAFENQDANIWILTGHTISGHTLKHFAAASSVAVVLPMLSRLAERRTSRLRRAKPPLRRPELEVDMEDSSMAHMEPRSVRERGSTRP